MQPLLWPVLAFAAGIILQACLPFVVPIPFVMILFLALMTLLFKRSGRSGFVMLPMMAAFALAGAWRSAGYDAAIKPPFGPGQVEAICKVSEDPVRRGSRLYMACVGESLSREGKVRPWHARLRVIAGAADRQPVWNDHIRLEGRLLQSGPGRFLLLAGEPQVLGSGGEGRWQKAVRLLKGRLEDVNHRTLGRQEAALMNAMVLGNGSEIDAGLQEAFRRTGTIHTLVVSGLSVSLILAAVMGLLCRLGMGLQAAAAAAIPILLLYTALVGGQPSITRAAIMSFIVLLGIVMGRRAEAVNSLCAAAFLILSINPRALCEPGFQLSFGAVLGLMLLTPVIADYFAGLLPRWLIMPLSASLGAQASVLPIIALHFNTLSPLAPLANLLVVPMLAPAMPLGLLADVAGLFSIHLAQGINLFNQGLLLLTAGVVRLLDRLPLMSLPVATPSALMVSLWYALLGLVALRGRLPGGRRVSRRAILVVALLIISPFLLRSAFDRMDSRLKVTFLDVGQGDAMLVRLPDGGNFLIDGGQAPLAGRLRAMGINELRAVILTHPHYDHLGGLLSVVGGLRVEEVLDTCQPHGSSSYERFLKEINRRRIPFKRIRQGYKLASAGVTLAVLHPADDLLSGTSSDLNNNSAVIRISYGRAVFLLAGDIQEEAEEKLVAAGGLKSGVLKVAHHGSRISSSRRFLKAVDPAIAIISVGSDNDYGHPGGETIRRLKQAGARIYRTDRDGSITVASDGRSLRIRSRR